jgi:hypothetical protein
MKLEILLNIIFWLAFILLAINESAIYIFVMFASYLVFYFIKLAVICKS